ncbi:putative acetyltransferase [Sodalis glossinidius str. 'morsitans']|uniref:Acetyltransferase n=1 Tax=Sodalis glossinidius (strain morsitans) TaxID=343509 RepID=Q2NRQ0_SODGM|nr:GNAT family N-acetyltransferase [Sodalis glossinidius]BAE75175.1 putative acetyltransferase [Sodalis glossinidius str. 'morsitans']
MTDILPVELSHPQLNALIQQLDDYQTGLYPPQSQHLLSPAQMARLKTFAWLARVRGEAAGCACLVIHPDGIAEVKRVYVAPGFRGYGIASGLLSALEAEASELGLDTLWLETGIYQPDAIALYDKWGYFPTAAFGAYCDDPLSVYWVKTLTSPTAQRPKID